jgi:phosphosulfolactate synthase (CoM biosynthesis protein A)
MDVNFYKKGFYIAVVIALAAIITTIFLNRPGSVDGPIAEQKRVIEQLKGELTGAKSELGSALRALAESEQSVDRLTEIDRERSAGIERIRSSLDATGIGIVNAQSGNDKTRAALEGIARTIAILKEEFGRSAE